MAVKQDILDYLSTNFIIEKTELNASMSSSATNFYDSVVLEFGKDTDGTDICLQKRITWVVYNEGNEVEEAAGLYKKTPSIETDRNLVSVSGSLTDQYKIYSNVETRNRVEGAACKAARNILNESSATSNHEERAKLAIDVLKNPSSWVNAFSRYVAANATIQSSGGSSTDSDLEYVCAVEFPWTEMGIRLYT